LFVGNEHKDIVKEDAIYGVPDVVIELSWEDQKRDETIKKDIYERAGVAEYFIINP
jgi:Uma2 family endonuclease